MRPVALDSLVASEFEVVMNDVPLEGIFRISDLVSYAVDSSGVRHMPPFRISKMVQQDASLPLNVWLRETISARHTTERPRRDLQIRAVDDGVVTRIWHVKGAYILSVAYSDFDDASFEMMQEIITLAYDDLEDEFTRR